MLHNPYNGTDVDPEDPSIVLHADNVEKTVDSVVIAEKKTLPKPSDDVSSDDETSPIQAQHHEVVVSATKTLLGFDQDATYVGLYKLELFLHELSCDVADDVMGVSIKLFDFPTVILTDKTQGHAGKQLLIKLALGRLLREPLKLLLVSLAVPTHPVIHGTAIVNISQLRGDLGTVQGGSIQFHDMLGKKTGSVTLFMRVGEVMTTSKVVDPAVASSSNPSTRVNVTGNDEIKDKTTNDDALDKEDVSNRFQPPTMFLHRDTVIEAHHTQQAAVRQAERVVERELGVVTIPTKHVHSDLFKQNMNANEDNSNNNDVENGAGCENSEETAKLLADFLKDAKRARRARVKQISSHAEEEASREKKGRVQSVRRGRTSRKSTPSGRQLTNAERAQQRREKGAKQLAENARIKAIKDHRKMYEAPEIGEVPVLPATLGKHKVKSKKNAPLQKVGVPDEKAPMTHAEFGAKLKAKDKALNKFFRGLSAEERRQLPQINPIHAPVHDNVKMYVSATAALGPYADQGPRNTKSKIVMNAEKKSARHRTYETTNKTLHAPQVSVLATGAPEVSDFNRRKIKFSHVGNESARVMALRRYK